MCKLLNKKLNMKKIVVAGTDYVGMSVATLLSQKNEVVAICLSWTNMKRPVVKQYRISFGWCCRS